MRPAVTGGGFSLGLIEGDRLACPCPWSPVDEFDSLRWASFLASAGERVERDGGEAEGEDDSWGNEAESLRLTGDAWMICGCGCDLIVGD